MSSSIFVAVDATTPSIIDEAVITDSHTRRGLIQVLLHQVAPQNLVG
jgi:hypothetical protein